jgi:hypothetical protein
MMEVATTATITVDRPPEVVAAYMFDPANDPRWIGGVRSARLLAPGPIAVGSLVEWVARFLGRRIEYVNEVVDLSPERLEMRSVKAPFPIHVTYLLRERNGVTEVSNAVDGDVGGFFGVLRPVVSRAIHRNVTKDLQRLKRRVESSG